MTDNNKNCFKYGVLYIIDTIIYEYVFQTYDEALDLFYEFLQKIDELNIEKIQLIDYEKEKIYHET